MTNPTNAYTVPSVSITTARTGASSKANALGMRAMMEPMQRSLKCQRGQFSHSNKMFECEN